MRAATALFVLLAACGGMGERKYPGLGEGEEAAMAGGVRLASGAQVVLGTAAFCTRPATVAMAQLEAASPEGMEIARDAVPRGSARYNLLHARMHQRIVRACTQAARAAGCDLVVVAGDIADARGLPVHDLTAEALQALRDGA